MIHGAVSSESCVAVYYQNVRGLRTKLADFYRSVLSHCYPVIVLSETWLNDSFYNSEIMDDRYIIYRVDRDPLKCHKNRGGGVLVAVLKSLYSCQLKCESNCEELWVRVKLISGDFIFCAVYIPPASEPAVYTDHLYHIEHFIDNNEESTVFIVGDYNLPDIRWIGSSDGRILCPSNVTNCAHQDFCDYLCFLNLSQFNHLSNCNGNILDLVLSSGLDVAVDRAEPLSTVDSYHPPLEIRIKCSQSAKLHSRPHSVYNFTHAPYHHINYCLSLANWSFLNHDDIDLVVHQFYNCLHVIIDTYVPVKTLYPSSYPVWVSRNTQALIAGKKSAHKKYKSSSSQVDYNIFSDLRSRAKACLEGDHAAYISDVENGIVDNPKNFGHSSGTLGRKLIYPTVCLLVIGLPLGVVIFAVCLLSSSSQITLLTIHPGHRLQVLL